MKDSIDLIRANVRNYPNRIAVIDGKIKISYFDFFNLVNSISNQLIINNSKPKVVFDLKQGIEAYALIVAVLNVGGTYCPLNADAPIDRKKQIINEFVPDFIVVEAETIITELNFKNVITIQKLLTEKDYAAIEIDYNGDDIIYVIYTSGSTGMPKGVEICRKSLNKFLNWSIPTYAVNENDIWGQFSFLSFDLSIVDIFTCLCSGATLLAINDIPEKKYRPAGIIEKEKITIWHSIPSAIEFMMVNEKSKFYDFSSLRLMSFCGEPLRKHQVEFLFEKKNSLVIFNTYGPTEGALFCTWQELRLDNYQNYCNFTLCIGHAIPGWSLKLNEVEGFKEKEIAIFGDYIGKGYVGTVADSKFRQIEIEGEIVSCFETGDLVTEKDGNIYFSGRKDRQVKIKGFRVELDEIDFWINEFLKKTSITVTKKDSLYSFIETKEDIEKDSLRDYLKKKIEPNKIPNDFYPIIEIPRSQNQKVDIKALIEILP